MKVRTRGAELNCAVRGEGPTCLVLSAIGTKPYELLMPRQLSDRLRLVFVDLRGAGRSTGEAADLTFDVLAADLEAVRVAIGVQRTAVLGHSILGALAIEYSRRCPESVSQVLAVGTPPSGDMERLAIEADAFFNADASADRKQVLHENLANLRADASPGQVMLAQTPRRFFNARFDASQLFDEAEVSLPFFAHLMGRLAPQWDVTIGSSSLRVPIFVAHGRYDYTVPYTLWERIAPSLPNVSLLTFQRSGHQPFFEEPDRFTEAVIAWMGTKR